jgi:hypothetical protein
MIGVRWGCALSLVCAVPLLLGLFAVSAFAECDAGVACRTAPGVRLILGAALIAIGIGFGTRLLVNLAFRRVAVARAEQERDGSET